MHIIHYTHHITHHTLHRTHVMVGQKKCHFFRTNAETLIQPMFGVYGTFHIMFVQYMTKSAKTRHQPMFRLYGKSTEVVRTLFLPFRTLNFPNMFIADPKIFSVPFSVSGFLLLSWFVACIFYFVIWLMEKFGVVFGVKYPAP